MNHRRPQFTLRSWMILIAVVALGLGGLANLRRVPIGQAFNTVHSTLSISALLPLAFLVSHFLVFKPWFWLIDEFRLRSDLRAVGRATAGRRP